MPEMTHQAMIFSLQYNAAWHLRAWCLYAPQGGREL